MIDEDVRALTKPMRLGLNLTAPAMHATVTVTIEPTNEQVDE